MNGIIKRKGRALLKQTLIYGRMIKFGHTVFALPFALSAVILAQRQHPMTFRDIFWIIIAMTGARSAAMGFNRIADAVFDAKNPRTADRAIPAAELPKTSAKLFVVFFSGLFIFASAMLGSLCLYLSVPVLAVLFSYSFSKRITWLCHFYLGFAISLAPLGAWIALTNTFSLPVLFLCLALLTYITGFDILYACQDIDFDKKAGLFSIPVYFGIKKALFISSVLHFFSFWFFLMIYIFFEMNAIYLGAVFIIGLLFVIEHRLVKPFDLSKIDIAFFYINSLISIILFVGIFADELVWRWM